MRALIVGIDSQIGSALALALRRANIDVIGTSRRASSNGNIMLDLAQPDLTLLPPVDLAFLCASETRQAVCRSNPQDTYRINVDAPAAIAKTFAGTQTQIVFTSSSAVFDGSSAFRRAEDPVCPISVYGQQKAEAERRLQALPGSTAVVRLTKTLPLDFQLFREWVVELRAGHPIQSFEDMVMAPLPVAHVAEALLIVAMSRTGGIFQVSGTRDISYAEVGRHIAARLGVSVARIVPRSAQSAGIPLNEIPAHTTLENSRIAALMRQRVPDPFDVIDEILAFATGMSLDRRDQTRQPVPSAP